MAETSTIGTDMEALLFIITVCSPLLAGVLALVVWRFYREECRRSDARIAALTEMALGEPDLDAKRSIAPAPSVTRPAIAPPAAPQPPPVVAQTVTPLSIAPSRVPRVDPPQAQRGVDPPAARPRVQPALDLPLHAAPAQPAAPTLFHAPERTSPWGARAVVMGGLALAAAAVMLFVLTARNTAATHSQLAAAPAASPAAAPGLELLSLRDTRQNGTLTITGLVQNPRGGAPLARIVVTAFAFDARGAFLASGRAPLDYTTLQPGEESPFLVTVPVPDTVARYRIGFRGLDGRVIAHVDRRQAATAMAENHE